MREQCVSGISWLRCASACLADARLSFQWFSKKGFSRRQGGRGVEG